MAGFLVSLPVPPSVNALYAHHKRRRYKTKKYDQWIERAGWEVMSQRPSPVKGPYRLYLSLPKTRGDPDNRIKAASDLLVNLGLIPDDRHATSVHAEVVDELKEYATVSVEAA